MMGFRAHVALAVFRAELTSVLRDRWTIAVSVLLPLLLYPSLGIGLTTVVARSVDSLRAQVTRVCLQGIPDDTEAIAEAFGREKPTPETQVVACPPGAEAKVGREIEAVVRVPDGTADALARNEGVPLEVLYSSTEARGAMARERVGEALAKFGASVVARRVEEAGLPRTFASPFQVKAKDVAPPQKSSLFTWVPIVVLFLILMSVLGVFLPAIDLTAGDRERNTLETLLVSPAAPGELIGGKFLVVLTLGLLSTVLNVGSLFGTIAVIGSGVPDLTLPVSLGAAFAVGLVSIPTVALSGAICIAIGCLARSFRDAQNYMTPVYLAIVIPAYSAALPTAKLTTFTAAVPLLNLPLLLKAILSGELVVSHIWIATATTLAFCAATLALAARLYGHQGIAFADAEPMDLLRRAPSATLRFSAGEAVALFAVSAAMFFYLGAPISSRLGTAGVMVSLLLCMLGPPVVYAFWRRLEWRTAFAFRRPGWRATAGAALLGTALWAPLGLLAWAQEQVFPLPVELREELRKLLFGDGHPWIVAIVVAAVTPAIAEEVLFRGAILQSLRPSLGRMAIPLTALLFGLLHGPWRLVPTFLLGLVLAAIVVRSGSIWTAIVLHFVHNATLVTIEMFVGSESLAEVPRLLLLWPASALLLGTWLLMTPSAPREGSATSREDASAPPVQPPGQPSGEEHAG